MHLDETAGRGAGRALRDCRVRGRQRRLQALHPPPVRAVPDHDAAAGGRPQARLHRPADHVGRPGPLRGAASSPICEPTPSRCPTPRSPPPAARSASSSASSYLPDKPRIYTSQGEERPGGARGDPAGRRDLPHPGPDRPDRRPVPALRADLDAHDRVADEGRRGRSRHGQDRPRAAAGPARRAPSSRPAGRSPSTASSRPTSRRADDGRRAADDSQTRLPDLTEGQSLRRDEPSARPATRPVRRRATPSRRWWPKLEELEIGRPSTYASIIRTITSPRLRLQEGTALVPTWLAFAVTRLLEEHFPRLVDYAFTAEMEEVLDEIADGERRADRGADRVLLRRADDRRGPAARWSPSSGDIDARKLSTFPVGDLDSDGIVRPGRPLRHLRRGRGGRRANVDRGSAAGRAHASIWPGSCCPSRG